MVINKFLCLMMLTGSFHFTAGANVLATAATDPAKYIGALKSNDKLLTETINSKLSVEGLLTDFFANTGCLPADIQKKIASNEKTSKLIPNSVRLAIKDVANMQVNKVYQKTLLSMLHSYEISSDTQGVVFEETPRFLKGASTVTNYNPYRNIDKNAPRFVYMLDCTGYVSHLAKADVGLTVFNAKGAASAAFNEQQTYVASRGLMTNVIAASLVPELFNDEQSLSNIDSLSVLANLLSEIKNEGSDKKIKVLREIDVISTARNGTTKLQGEVDASGSISTGFGVGSYSGETKSGFGVTKTIEFLSPDTAIIREEGKALLFSMEDIKQRFASNLSKVSIKGKSRVNDAIIIYVPIPENICINPIWKASLYLTENGTTTNQDQTLNASFVDGTCTLQMNINSFVEKLINAHGTTVIKPSGSYFDTLSTGQVPSYSISF